MFAGFGVLKFSKAGGLRFEVTLGRTQCRTFRSGPIWSKCKEGWELQAGRKNCLT